MAILDKSKIRKDILKLSNKARKVILRGAAQFLDREENKGKFGLPDLMKLMVVDNKQFFDELAEGKGTVDDLYGRMEMDQMIFLAQLFRAATDFQAEFDQKKKPISEDVELEGINIEGVPAEWQNNPNVADDRVLLYFHGGGQILGSPKNSRPLGVELGRVCNTKVLSVHYSLAPEKPFPAGVNDCLKSYQWLLSTGIKPENVIFGGASAGGNMVCATLLKARDGGIPLPRGAICLSPGIDYTPESKTILTNAPTDPTLADVGIFWWIPAYVAGADPYNPYVSPVHADMKGLPPILVQVSKIEMLYDHSTRFVERAKAAGVDATLQEWDEMPHVWQGNFNEGLPEAREAIDKIAEFVKNLFN